MMRHVTAAVEKIRHQVSSLSNEERAELAHFLIRSLDDAPDPDRERAWEIELQRRGEEILAGKAVGIPAEQVFADLRTRKP